MSGTNGALTRLNYFNGMRLEAPDLRVEQTYHIDVRQRLTRALFSPGIAEGLEVVPSTNDPHHVVVRPGLAIDHLGRVIVIDEDQEVLVQGIPSSEPGWVFGNYLTISYAEQKENEADDGCQVKGGCCDVAWGGPTRIVARPLLAFQDAWPQPESGAVVLAQVELDDSCAVKAVKSAVRKYVTPISGAARSFALEGEREIDAANPKTLVFHLRGPTRQVVLYLRALKFSTLFYTEVGRHQHAVELETELDGNVGGHTHDVELGELESSEPTPPTHAHVVSGKVNDDEDSCLDLDTGGTIKNLNTQLGFVLSQEGNHTHTFPGGTVTTTENGSAPNHSHAIEGDTELAGHPVDFRGGQEYRWVKDLKVIVDGADLTPGILAHLGWAELGDGSSAHDLATLGTAMGIPLDQLGLDTKDGEHIIELSVPSGGGTIQYNLYVE
jgi:hypothetical protein